MPNKDCNQKNSPVHCDCEAKEMLMNIQQFAYLIEQHTKEFRNLLEEQPSNPFFMGFLEHSLNDVELKLESIGELRSFLKSAQETTLSNNESWGPATDSQSHVMN